LGFQALTVAAVRVLVQSTELTVDSFGTIAVVLSLYRGWGSQVNPVAIIRRTRG